MSTEQVTRRRFMRGALLGTGLLGLRSLATGLPVEFLRSRNVARAQAAVLGNPTALILAHSGQGDPLNANCPGSYVAGVENNDSPLLAPTDFILGQMQTRAAAPWASLDAELRARMCFFHHQTYANAHPEMGKVLLGHGAVKDPGGSSATMLASMFSSRLAGPLGSTQREPIAMGSDRITFEGRPLDLVRPTDVQGLFDSPSELVDQLRALRDAELDQVYAELKQSGTRAQRAFLDRYAQGRVQARQLGEQLGALLERVPSDGEANGAHDQIICAVALLRLNVTPVVTLNIPFGGDNHADSDLAIEANETVAGVAALQFLYDELTAAGLQDKVSFATLNVFGRTLLRNGAGGRNHNRDHHVMCMFGPGIQGSVVGGIARTGRDFGAVAIDSQTGRGAPDGDIAESVSLQSAMATLASAVGLSDGDVGDGIAGGIPVRAALR